MRITDLKVGESAVIQSIGKGMLANKLMEMGCLPGETIEVTYKAPLGGPIAINVFGYILGIRREEADFLEVEKCS